MKSAPKALITGVTGQDGAYLARYLCDIGYTVIGTSRDADVCGKQRLEALGIEGQIDIRSVTLHDFRNVLKTIAEVRPDEIYNLAGQTSVSLSFEQPVEAMESIAYGALNILEAIRFLNLDCRIFNAGSSECFGNQAAGEFADERTALRPQSPYGVAKSTALWQTTSYRDAYGLQCCTGIMSNHESPLRPQRFVTKKITSSARLIKEGKLKTIELGDINIIRDWGWAWEYVQAIHIMTTANKMNDYVIASGSTHSLRDFTDEVFRGFGLNLADHLIINESWKRPNEIARSALNPKRIYSDLGWKASIGIEEIARKLIAQELT